MGSSHQYLLSHGELSNPKCLVNLLGYVLLDLITFFTVGGKENRAWTIKNGSKSPRAAGVIHSDFEKGFIRAKVYSYEDLVKLKTESSVKDVGLLRLEGKDYRIGTLYAQQRPPESPGRGLNHCP